MAAGRIVLPQWMPALDADGVPISNASMFFYQNMTTTLQSIYADQALTIPLDNPLSANSSGQFADVWADNANLFSITVDAPFGPPGVPFTYDNVTPGENTGDFSSFAKKDSSNLTPADISAWNTTLGLDANNLGFWNALTNTPTLVSSVGEEGRYYTVSVQGTTSLNGTSTWDVGDKVVFTGGAWTKVSAADGSSILYTTLEEHGGKADDSTFDNAAAFVAAEAYLTARMTSEPGFKGVLMLRGAVDYYFKDTLLMKRTGGAWIGERTRLIYNGASTTKDLVVFGHYNGGEPLAGKPQTRDVYVSGIQILSATLMTAGCAVRTRSCIESTFKFELQTQTGYETLGHNLWNGLWNEWSSTVIYEGLTYVARNNVIMINGAPGTSGGKSDAWFDIGKIAGGQLGCLIGGGFGGLWFGTRTTFIANKTHIREDQTLTAESNREVMYKGCTIDFVDDAIGSTGGSVGVDIVGPGECFHDFVGCWIANHKGASIIVRATSNAFLNLSGNRFFIGQPSTIEPALLGHAVVTDSAAATIFINGGQVRSYPGIVFRSRVAGHNMNFTCVDVTNCPAGVYDPAFASSTATSLRALSGLQQTRALYVENNLRVGVTDSNFGMLRQAGNPVIDFDANDFLQYDRSANTWIFKVGGADAFALGTGGIKIGSAPTISMYYITGTLDGSGNAAGSLPIAAANILYGFVSVLNGNGAYTVAVQVQGDGSNYSIVNNAGNAGKAFKGFVWYLG